MDHNPATEATHDQRGDDVLELPDVARPVIADQRGQRRPRGGGAAPGDRLCLAPEVLGEQEHVVVAITQRRQRDPQDIDPVQEVLAESPRRHVRLERPVGRRHDPHVDPTWQVLTESADLAVLEHPQQLGLCPRRQLADFIQEQRAPIRRLEQPGAFGHRAGERAAGVAKELRLDELIGQGRAVDRAEAPVGPPAEPVDRAGHQFLSAPALPCHQHGIRGLRDTAHRTPQLVHGGTPAQ